MNPKTDFITHDITRRDFLGGTITAAGMLAVPWLEQTTEARVSNEQRQRIEAAIPSKAFVSPRKKRKLLIFDLNVGYGGHGSIPTANMAFTLMGKKTGAFETVISKSVRLEESPAYRESIFSHAPNSSGAYEYYKLSEEVLSRV